VNNNLDSKTTFSIQATSKLLVNYPEDLRNQILDYLFKVR